MRHAPKLIALNPRHPLSKEVLCLWPMVERGRKCMDIGPLRKHGTWATTGGAANWQNSIFGPAALFDPATTPNGISIGASNSIIPYTVTNGVTVVMYARINQINFSRALFKLGNAAGSRLAVWIAATANKLAARYRNGAGTLTSLNSVRDMVVGEHVWIACVYAEGLVQLWINGYLEAQATDLSVAQTIGALDTTAAYIGASTSTVNIFSGLIGQTALFRRRLYPSELRSLYYDFEGLMSSPRLVLGATLEVAPPGDDPPGVPTDVTATPGHTQITVAWTPPVDEDINHYEIHRAEGGGYAKVGESATASYVDTTVTPGTTYTYEVLAVDAAAQSGSLSAASAGAVAYPAYIYRNSSLNLDGSTQYGNIPQAIAEAVADLGAVMVWLAPDFLPAEETTRNVIHVAQGASILNLMKRNVADDMQVLNNGRYSITDVAGGWAAGQWISLIYQWEKATDTLDLYIDGVEATGSKAGTWGADAVSGVIGVGATSGGTSKVDGRIGRVCFWNRLLTPTEIATLQRKLPLIAAPSGRVCEWAPGGSVQNLLDVSSEVTLFGSPVAMSGPPQLGRKRMMLMGV